MNERIRELADEAARFSAVMALPTGESGDELFVKRFAELIVEECVRYVNAEYQRDFESKWREDLSNGIKKHFSVEESPAPVVTVDMVKRLREETNRPMMECKKALYACNSDYEQAKQWLLDQRYYRNKI